MNNGLRLAVSLSTLLAAPAAFADPGATTIPGGSTVVVVTPAAPVMVTGPAQVSPPGADELPPSAVPAPTVTAAAAPQNEDWNNVSHINGSLVPVGERGSYLYKWKKTNISSNPIGWMMGFYGLSVSHAVGDHLALRGDANLFRPVESEESGYEVGVTLPLYLKRVYQGPFIEPGVMIRDFNTSDAAGAFIGPQVNIGWHWTFDSGFNISAAVGVARRIAQPGMSSSSTSESDYDSDYQSPIEPTGYFRVGYAY